jgi:SAM-dependent methyltransferase
LIRLLCYNQLMSTPDPQRRTFLLIFIASLCSLAYELALVRIFSITLWYHFAFMVISTAMLGIGASGTFLAVLPKFNDLRRLPAYGLAFGAAIAGSYLAANAVPFDPARIAWDRSQLLLIGLYYLALSVPFFCFGLIVTVAFSSMKGAIGAVYASDLLGACAGSLLIFWLLFQGGPERSVFIASGLAAGAVLALSRGAVRAASAIMVALDLAALLTSPGFLEPRMSPYKPLQVALQFPGSRLLETSYGPYSRVDVFSGPAARFAPGLSLTNLDPLPPQTGIAVDGGEIHALTAFRDERDASFLDVLPSGLPYVLAPAQDVLVLESKGGLSVALAERFGARTVTALESNPLVLSLLAGRYAGPVGTRSDVRFHAALGRSWLKAAGRSFDLIDLSLPGALPSASYGFAEDYRFTREAFRTYLNGLKPGGVLSVTVYLLPPPRAELRLLATVIAAARDVGITDAPSHVAAVRTWGTLTLLFKRSPLTGADVAAVRRFSSDRRFDVVHVPGTGREETGRFIRTSGSDHAAAFRELFDEQRAGSFTEGYPFDIRPMTDDAPFSHYYLKLGNIGEIYRLAGGKWQYFFEEGYLLPLLVLQLAVLGGLLMLLPLFLAKSGKEGTKGFGPLLPLAYFGLIGLAYLFIEVAFIQKMILVLEHPAYAAGTVIAAVLAGSGAGSYVSGRGGPFGRPLLLALLAAVAAGYALFLPAFAAKVAALPAAARFAAVFAALLPAGFLMGIPLPLGMTYLGGRQPFLIPWAWAVNGCCSVLSPVLAVMIALVSGYQVVIYCGAGLYLAGFLLIRQVMGHRS